MKKRRVTPPSPGFAPAAPVSRSVLAAVAVLLSCAWTLQCSGDRERPPSAAAGEGGSPAPSGGSTTGPEAESGAGGSDVATGAVTGSGGAPECAIEALDAYQQRIEPLLVDDNPKSCNQCHLSGVDLSMFVRSTPCETMACLVDQGLVDLAAPEQSKILGWIERAAPDSELITEAVIQAEYDGFKQWIEANARCPEACSGVECESPSGPESCTNVPAPRLPPEPLTGTPDCSEAAIEQSFADNVYAWRGRCFPCHHSDQLMADADAPRWIRGEGNCAAASLATLRQVEAGGYIDIAEPAQSLLLLKPLAESEGGVTHGGHDKFADANDAAYQSFLKFLQTYAACKPPAP